jgi:hypothetical protein
MVSLGVEEVFIFVRHLLENQLLPYTSGIVLATLAGAR